MTLVEVMVSVLVLTLCTWMLSTTLMASSRHAENKREQAWASAACFNVVEDLHAVAFEEVFVRFNDVLEDDLPGAGSGTAGHFDVEGLQPLPGDADGHVGRIRLPSSQGLLREDTVDERLGMPRDLDGDLRVDGEDHSQDYALLPVVVEVEWQSASGRRTFFVETVLSGPRRNER